MIDVRLNIWSGDVIEMLTLEDKRIMAARLLECNVLRLEEAIDCFSREKVEMWLKLYAEDYGYKKEE